MAFPQTRMRRLRATAGLRGLVRETDLTADRLILPLFVTDADGAPAREPIEAMPGVERLSVQSAVAGGRQALGLGLAGVLLFGIPDEKDEQGSGAWDREGAVQLAAGAIKRACTGAAGRHRRLPVRVHRATATAASCARTAPSTTTRRVELIARTAVSHARAGADLVAPSDMMDGRVGAIREALDDEGFPDTPIIAYSAKFASAFYGPFRDAAGSTPAFGDRRGYQMDPANGREAVREAMLDVQEGADMVMVKPALAYGDLISAVGGGDRAAGGRVQRQRRVCDGQGGRGGRRHRRARGGAGDPHLAAPGRRGHDHHLPRKGRGPMAGAEHMMGHAEHRTG